MTARCAGIVKILSWHELKLAAQSAQRLIVLVVKEALALLIEAGAPLEAATPDGITPLEMAVDAAGASQPAGHEPQRSLIAFGICLFVGIYRRRCKLNNMGI